jgi:hypothetical protein
LGNKSSSNEVLSLCRPKKGYPFEGGFWIKTNIMDFPGGGHGVMSFLFPYVPKQMDNIIDIIVYSKVNISEFDFTSFYGEIS